MEEPLNLYEVAREFLEIEIKKPFLEFVPFQIPSNPYTWQDSFYNTFIQNLQLKRCKSVLLRESLILDTNGGWKIWPSEKGIKALYMKVLMGIWFKDKPYSSLFIL